MNPKVLLTKLPETFPNPPSSTPQQQPPSETNYQERNHEQLLTTEKVISFLQSSSHRHSYQINKNTCLLCSQDFKPSLAAAKISCNNSDQINTFCKVFNTTSATIDQDLFNLCTNCTEELELLNYADKEFQIAKRRLERRRNGLINIIVRNYVGKTRPVGRPTRSARCETEGVIDQLTQSKSIPT